MPVQEIDYEKIFPAVSSLITEVANYIRLERKGFTEERIAQKALNDLVSDVDKGAEEKLVNGLKQIFPLAGFIAEENTGLPAEEWNWIIDPLDGTTNFIHDISCYCISVALVRQKEPVLAVVHEVRDDRQYYTWKNAGASYCNGEKIKVSKAKKLGDALIATGFPVNNFDATDSYFLLLRELFQKTRGVRRLGAAAADLCYVAEGKFSAFFEYNLKPWDVAAGALIVKNAGGKIYDFGGGNAWLFGRQIVAVSPELEEEFMPLLQQAFKNFIR